jgi:serine/threonine-protein kinase
VIEMMIQACASLAEAHDAGLFHRDIKPPNLYLCRAADEVDIIKLLDFGIVQDAREPRPVERMREVVDLAPGVEDSKLTRAGAMLGTPGFMAPEQILGMQLDGRADLYALGCCAWWLLAGGEVFDRRTAEGAKLLYKHIYDPAPDLRVRVRGWCPPELAALVGACLAKEIDDRPANARELAARLRAIEIPPEHAWTPAHALRWWSEYQAPEVPPAAPAEVQQVIMPGRTARRSTVPVVTEEALAVTLAPPSRRGGGDR